MHLCFIYQCIDTDTKNLDHFKSMKYAGLVFSILALASFIFIYIMTDLNTNDWWVLLLLKKGTYSCLIVLIWYYFCYNIYYTHQASVENEDPVKALDWFKGCGLAFSIIFGIGSLAFSFIFKDLVACGMNLFRYNNDGFISRTSCLFALNKKRGMFKKLNKIKFIIIL